MRESSIVLLLNELGSCNDYDYFSQQKIIFTAVGRLDFPPFFGSSIHVRMDTLYAHNKKHLHLFQYMWIAVHYIFRADGKGNGLGNESFVIITNTQLAHYNAKQSIVPNTKTKNQ